jgi:hypothetical protein
VDAGASDAPTGNTCQTDTDCVFRANAGCCGQCLAKTAAIPARPICTAVLCPAVVPSCGCVNHVCVAVTRCAADQTSGAAAPADRIAPPICTQAQ